MLNTQRIVLLLILVFSVYSAYLLHSSTTAPIIKNQQNQLSENLAILKQVDTNKAKRLLIIWIQQFPQQFVYRQKLAQLLLDNKQANQAESVLRQAVEQLNDNTQAIILLVDYLARYRTIEQATAELIPWLEAEPNNIELQLKMVELQIAKGDYILAEQTLKQKIEKHNNKAIALQLRLARFYAQKQDITSAERLLTELLAVNNKYYPALLLRAELHLQQKQTFLAINELLALIQIQPNNTQLLTHLSVAYSYANQYDLAKQSLLKALLLEPNNHAIRLQLARLYWQNNDIIGFQQQLNTIFSKDPQNQSALETLTEYYLSQQKWTKAQAIAQRLIQFHQQAVTGYYLAGSIEFQQRYYAKSIVYFQQALYYQPHAVEPLIKLIQAYKANQQKPAAMSFLQNLLKQEPQNQLARQLLNQLH